MHAWWCSCPSWLESLFRESHYIEEEKVENKMWLTIYWVVLSPIWVSLMRLNGVKWGQGEGEKRGRGITYQLWLSVLGNIPGNIYYARKYLYSARKSCTVRGKVVIPSYIYYLCPKTFIWVHKHFSLCGNIKSSRRNLFTVRGNLFIARGNLCAAWKYIHCARKLMCCAEIFSSPRKFFCLCAEVIMSHARILGFQPF